jgi:hypothetical protein
MVTLREEERSISRMPGFADRLVILGDFPSAQGRWFPFAYEVIIMQWSSILSVNERWKEKRLSTVNSASYRGCDVALAAAPMLFEVMKQSIGFRV